MWGFGVSGAGIRGARFRDLGLWIVGLGCLFSA